jgi:prepilin peptidase CpaA
MAYSTPELVVGLFAALLIWAAFDDVRYYIIPNRIVLAIAALFPIYVLASGDPAAYAWHPLVALIVFAIGLGLFATGLVGGGDVKLLTAVALWAGPLMIVEFIVITTLLGAALAVFLLSRFGYFLPAPTIGKLRGAEARGAHRQAMPYGLAIAGAGLYVVARLAGILA